MLEKAFHLSEQNLGEFDQNARIVLTNHCASHLGYWGTNMLTIAIAFFTAFAAVNFLGAHSHLALILLATRSFRVL